MRLRPLTKLSYRRWTEEEESVLKDMFMSGRQQGIPHKQLWHQIADKLDRKPTEVQRKVTRMYYKDDELKNLKQKNWTREKILEELADLYRNNKEMHKSALPSQLCFTILKTCSPNSRNWFESLDHAIAEAILNVGFQRNEDGTLDEYSPIKTIEEALDYTRKGHKRRHIWTLDEIKQILAAMHDADYPLTIPFMTNHYDIYGKTIGLNRKLESFKDVIKKFIEDGSIKSYPDLVCTIAPEYIAYYNDDKSRLKLSSEEIRVKKFLDRLKIPYEIPRISHKLPTLLENYPNFVPDFVINDDEGNLVAIVEVFGSIGDRENANVNELYANKTLAKQKFWSSVPGIKFVEVHNNNGKCDLDDRTLYRLFGSLLNKKPKPIDLQDIITTVEADQNNILKKYGAVILYKDDAYTFKSAELNLKFDNLFDLAELRKKHPNLDKTIELIQRLRSKGLEPHNSKFPHNDYEPSPKDPYYDQNRQLGTDHAESLYPNY